MQTHPIKILADGTYLEAGSPRTDHVAVLWPEAGLMIHTVSLGDDEGDPLENWDTCCQRCRDLRVLGFDDWQLAGRDVWERHVLDLTHYNPAVDPSLYPGITSRWHHTSTAAAWSRSVAWYVNARYGYVSYLDRDGSGFALAVRRVGQ